MKRYLIVGSIIVLLYLSANLQRKFQNTESSTIGSLYSDLSSPGIVEVTQFLDAHTDIKSRIEFRGPGSTNELILQTREGLSFKGAESILQVLMKASTN